MFNKTFLVDDQQEWSRRKAPTESKIDDGNSSVRVYGGQPPPEELLMQFKDWIDGMNLFIKYVKYVGWETMAKRFEGHQTVVMELRENYGWMIALRYCRQIRQGVMRETNEPIHSWRPVSTPEPPHRNASDIILFSTSKEGNLRIDVCETSDLGR